MIDVHRAITNACIVLAIACLVSSHAIASTARPHPATTEDLFALRDIGGLLQENIVPSPSADAVAFFEREIDLAGNRYIHRLVIVDLTTRHARVVAEAGDFLLHSVRGRRSGAPLDRAPLWSPDGSWIYYLAERNHAVEIWRARADGSVTEPVLAPPGDVRRIAFTSAGLLMFESSTSRTDLAAHRQRQEREGFLVDDNFTPLFSRLPIPDEDGGAEILVLDQNTGETRRATDGERAAFEPAASPATIAPLDAASTASTPPLGLTFRAGDIVTLCNADACDGALQGAWVFDANGAPLVIFRRLEGHARRKTSLYAWRPGENETRLIRSETDRLSGCVAAARRLLCLQDFATQPRRLVSIDPLTGAFEVLYDPNTEWRSVQMPRIETIEHTDGEGNQSFGQLVYPIGYRRGRSYPLVIVQYRARGFLHAGTGSEVPIFPLSARGFFVLSVERPEFDERATRLSVTDLIRETEFDGSENRIKREAILAFVDSLRSRRLIDMGRLAITGMSDGAETAFDLVTETDLFRAIVVASPSSGPLSYALQSRRFRRVRLEQFGLTPPWDESSPTHSYWEENSAELRTDRLRAALLINAPESEMLSSFALLARLEQTSTPVETYIYPGAYHLKWLPSQIWTTQERTIAWLDFWLRDVAPRDTAQSERWRAMRERADQGRLAASPSASPSLP